MLTGDNNQSSSFSVSPLSPHLLTSFLPSLFPFLSVSLSLLVILRCAQESTASLKAWVLIMLRTTSISHSQGRREGAPSSASQGAHTALCLQRWQVWPGVPGEAEDPLSRVSLQTIEESPQTDGLCGPLRTSAALLCQTSRTCCPE